eukprot:TRINITY_DN4474_c0_g1_i1.p1 TRINITY_DN4474_c0_g1~~TRINITY_DN4474_c0_g1_i1.p1  ORF type:complete len:200 (-),score=39.62 TRINITY_DN4474_c0_g1_i1:22-621(-)
MFSFKCSVSDGRSLPFLQYLVSLAVVKSIKLMDPQYAPVDIKIKWPNDIYGDGLKIGGVLCQSSYFNSQFDVIVGVGLNVNNTEPTTCVEALVQSVCPGARVTREAVLANFLEQFEIMFSAFVADGFLPFVREYLLHWMHSGQQVTLATPNGTRREVSVQGLSDNGFLLATDRAGETYELHPDGNSFDIAALTIRPKQR